MSVNVTTNTTKVCITTSSPKVVVNAVTNTAKVSLSVSQNMLSSLSLIANFIVGVGGPMEPGDTEYSNQSLSKTPYVFIDGILQTTVERSDRRYIIHDSINKKITIIGGVNEGENVQILI